MARVYKQITSAADLKALHEEAKAKGAKEVGISKGKILYAWDEQRNNIRVISTVEAAARLELTVQQVDKIIETDGKISFEEPQLEEEVVETATFQDLTILEAVASEDAPQEEPVVVVAETPAEAQETPKSDAPDAEYAPCEQAKTEEATIASFDAPESVPQEDDHVEKVVSGWAEAFKTFAEDIAAAAERLKNTIK